MKQIQKLYVYFLLVAMLIMYSIILKVARLFSQQSKVTCVLFSLTPEQVFKKSNPLEIHEFLREERFQPFFNPECTIIECRSWKTFLSRKYGIVFDATLTLANIYLRRISILDIVKKAFLVSKIEVKVGKSASVKFVKNEILDPSIWLLMAENMETQIDILATQSWMNRSGFIHSIKNLTIFKKTMLWYSTNSEPIPLEGVAEDEIRVPLQVVDCFDTHLVWNSYQASFLKSNGINRAIAIGPLLFQSKVEVSKEPKLDTILFTDVTPTSDESFFYNLRMSVSTLQTIVDVVDELKKECELDIRLCLKPKRRYSSFHSKEYVKLVKDLVKSEQIVLLDANSNLYEVISKSRFLLSTPYTSTNFIASELGVPSAFFCQNFEPWIMEEYHHGFEVITTRSRLKSILKDSFDNE